MSEPKVQWREWSRSAFDEARTAGKPILLSISATWCHWCHRMDKDNYEDAETTKLVNDLYVPVRVDTDRRPDVNERYNQGGWPSTAFLDAEGRVIAGGTYIPPATFKQALRRIAQELQESSSGRLRVERVERVTEKPATKPLETAAAMSPAAAMGLEEVVPQEIRLLSSSFDDLFGGFGNAPKFPAPYAVELALLAWRKTGKAEYELIARKTLDGMLNIFDSKDGGFFRYATRREWIAPHYEKMLETNAQMLRLYSLAYFLTQNKEYELAAKDTSKFIEENLFGKAFYASMNSEEEYYQTEDRKRMQPPSVDQTYFADMNGLAAYCFLDATNWLGNSRLKGVAYKAIDNCLQSLVDINGKVTHFKGSQLNGLLADQAWLSIACLRAFEQDAPQRTRYLNSARHIIEWTLENLDSKGAFYGDLGLEIGQERTKPMDSNAVFCNALFKLAHIDRREALFQKARLALEEYAGTFTLYGPNASGYALSVYGLLNNFEITLVDIGAGEKPLYGEALKLFEPAKTLIPLNIRDEMVAQRGYPQKSACYVCGSGLCLTAQNELELQQHVAKLAKLSI
ncbi:thioredoxin domain-containing protein [archaeon]|nr:thioredoxin domain-containing protein [archaeon]